MLKISSWFLAILLMLITGGAAAQQNQRRIALVIGNAEYTVPAWRLANPANDADLMALRLTKLGFTVEKINNAKRAQMDMAFERFGQRLRAGGRNAVGFFYYSGHGAEESGVNYLVPVDADIRTKEQLRYRAPSAQLVLDDMASAGNLVNFVILDACRDLPLPDAATSLGRGGLADLPQVANVLIAYATAPGQTASDGAGRNSPFTAALAEALRTKPNDAVSLLFEDVQANVRAATNGNQRPRFSNGLGVPRWSLATGAPLPNAPAPAPNENPLSRRKTVDLEAAPAEAAPAALDARSTPASTSAPVVSNPASLPDFALFRDCTDCPEMVVMPAGRFLMGSPASEAGRYEDEDDKAGAGGRQVNVSVPRFAISRFEVTKADYAAFVGATGRADPKVAGDTYCIWRSPGFAQSDRDPVACVNTTDAADYAAWLSRLGGGLYRLPSEAEWEYAARGGMSTRWSFGDAESQLGTYAWFSSNSGGRTQPVGGKVPNPFGLFDMHGNVWEWVEDCYRDNLSGQTAAAHTTSGCLSRVYRGGSWDYLPQNLRSALRGRITPTVRNLSFGFRLSRTL